MKITILGAAGGEVTGSAYLVRTGAAQVLIDFGMFQGGHEADELNHVPAELAMDRLDAVLLTHAHLDHVGRLPLLERGGYAGPVRCTPATIDLAGLILRDSAKVQASDLERTNRRRRRAGKEPLEPLYDAGHVEAIMGRFAAVPYNSPVAVADGISARFVEAGHMLGSASIELTVEEKGARKTVIFSGDLGPWGAPILKDPEPFQGGDMVFLESTYGDRDHKPFAQTVEEFIVIVREAAAAKGKMLVPTFAVGRAQVMLALLAWMFRRGKVKPFPVYLDSPMAVQASKIYEEHPELFDEETLAFLRERPIAEDLEMAHSKATVTPEESKALNDVRGPCMILAGAGMCNAGRILHHLRQNLWKPETRVLIVGYQAHGSLGRLLVDGAREVKIFGEPIAVRANVHTLGGFSAHAGQRDLLHWFGALAPSKPRVILTHGENRSREALAKCIQNKFGIRSSTPGLHDTVEL
ncbi:MAG TPA: MBL fold metallo-hydrolase [Verrucomicrobiae bacterium]|nr:MBL fold metallo-hydrolase [Verrucomicrobiae bacterium]